jgi:hypothetical protein
LLTPYLAASTDGTPAHRDLPRETAELQRR